MKTLIRKTLTAVAFAIGFTTAATAATPVAVWDGNFPVADVEDQGFTLTYNGNTRGTDGKNITIADTAGLGVTFAKSGMAATTVAVKYSDYTGSTTANETLGTFSANSTAANRVGIHRYADGTIYGSYSSDNLTSDKNDGSGSFAGSTNKDVFFLRYSNNGVSIFAKDGTCLYRNGGYKFGSDFDGRTPVYAFTVGGASTSTFSSLAAATGMEITGVAVFDAELTSADMAAYQFPSDPLYGYHYNGNGNAYTPSSFTTSSSGNFVDGFLDQAMWINGNAGYGSGLSIGDNDFTVVFVAKSANTQNKIFFGLGSKSAAGFGFVSNGSSGLKFGNWSSSSLVFDQALNVASGQDATADYHTYVVKYVKSETKAYYSVDGSDYTEISTAMVWSDNGNWQIGSIYGGTVGSYAAGNAGAMDELRIYQKCLSIDDVKAIVKEFSPSETYTATIPTGDVAFGDITWDDSKTWSSGSKVQAELTLQGDTTLTLDANYTGRKLAIKSTAGQKLTLNTTGNGFKFLDLSAAAGKVILAGIDGLELAKNAVAGAPYSYWIGSTVTGEANLETPVVPSGYTIALNTVPGVGSRFVVTAPAAAKFGSININFAGGRNSVTFNDEAKVGSQTTMQGGYPVIGTSWNDLEAKNYTGTATKYIDTDGTVKTDGNVSVAVSQCNNPYTTGQDSDKYTITYGYIDDGGHPIINISNIPFAKYRIIVYRASDDGSARTFSAVQIGTTSSNTKIYYGPTQSSTVGGLTIRGTSEVVWGYNKQTGYTEGMNYIVSDVLTGTAGSATAYIYSHKHAGRAGVAAIQIVEVGVGVVPQRATFSMSVWDTTSEKQLISANKYAGYLPVAGAFWDQIEGTDHNGHPFSRDVNLTMYKSDGTTTANAANVTVSGNNTYMTGGTKTTGNGELTYNFIDDAQYQSTGRAGGFSFSNIPFTKYTVYVYMGSDSSNTSELLGPVNVKIGDTTTAYPSGGESGWGGRGYTREISGVLTFDATKNMVVIENMTASAFELTGSLNGTPANTRGGIAGIQIVDTSDPVAQIGINLYGSLNEAAAAVTSGGTIKLVAACNQALTTDKTFTLDLNGFAYNGELAVGSAGAVTLKNDSAFAGTITGAGTIVYDGNGAGTLPAAPSGVAADTWTGTVWLKSYTVNAFNFSALANPGSKVKLTGMRGYAPSGAKENDLELVLEDDGDTKALTITDGYGDTRFSVTRLSGDGTFVAAGSQDAQSQYRFKDASKFAGAFDLSQMGSNKRNKRVIIGTGSDTLADPGCILVEAGAAVTIAAGKTWKVGDTKTITVNGSIGGAGTLGSNTTFGNGAEIVATNGTLNATGTLTFNQTSTKVRVAVQPSEGSLTTVVAKSGLSEADIDTVVSVYVGDSETADASMQYKLVSNANGVCLSAPAREHLTWNGTAWETAGGQPVATIASYHVLEAHAGDNITFSAATAPYAFVLPTTGEVTVSGQNYLTVDAVEISENATLTLGSDAVPGFSVTGTGTLAYNPGSTPESATVVAADKLSGFTGTFWLKSGRHGYSSAIAAAVKIKVTDGAQLYIGGGTWNNAFTLSGSGYKRTEGNRGNCKTSALTACPSA